MTLKDRILSQSLPTVSYPFSGNRVILRWYTYNKQSSIFIAKRQADVVRMIDILLEQRNFDLKLMDYYSATLVAPAEWHIERYNENLWQDSRRIALEYVVRLYHQYYSECFDDLPKGLAICTDYKYRYEVRADENIKDLIADDPKHYSCSNCVEGIRVSADEEAIIRLYWNRQISKNKVDYKRNKPIKSLGLPQIDRDVFFAYSQSQSGAAIAELEPNMVIPENCMFYFIGTKLPTDEWDEKIRVAKVEHQTREKVKEKLQSSRHSKFKDEKALELLEYLGY